MRALLSPDDLKDRSFDPGWYPAEITKVEFAITKGSEAKPSDGSENCIVYHSVSNPGKPGSKPRELRRYFNEKVMGSGKNLWFVTGLLIKGSTKDQELTNEMLKSMEGKKLQVYIKKNAGGYDEIADYRSL